MIDSINLYVKRKTNSKKAQVELVSSFLEWTYVFYVLLPLTLLVLFGYFYMWIGDSPWINMIPFPVVHLSLFVVIYTNNLRTHVVYADQLFLARNTSIIDGMIEQGFIKFMKHELLKIIFTFILIAPYLIAHLHTVEMLTYFIMFSLFDIFYSLYRYSIWHRKWLSFALSILYICIGVFLNIWLLISVSFVCLGLIVYLLMNIDYENKTFDQWLEIEVVNASKMDRWLLMVAKLTMKRYGIEVIKRETKFQRFIMHNLPINRLVFKQRSQKNVLIESFFKWFYRQPLFWGYGIQIIVFNSLVLLLMNVSISIIVSIVCLWILHTYYKSLWARFIMHAFMNLYSWPASFHAKKAIQKSILIGYSIFIVLFIIAKILWLPSNMMESILHVVYDM